MAKGKAGIWLCGDGLLQIKAWARDGATDEILAKKMGISRSTLSEWKIKHPVFAEALARTKEIVDIEVENELLRNATGYEYTETQWFKVKKTVYEDGKKVLEEEELVEKEVTKWHPGDIKAQEYWLNNRNPEKWKYRKEEVDEDADKPAVVEFLTPDDARWGE